MMAILLSLLFATGFLEIILRIFGPPYYRFNNLSEEYYTNPRGYHDVIRKEGKHTVFGLTYHEDSHGYRISPGDDHSSAEMVEKYVLGLGDSFFYGRGVRYEDICLTRLEKMLNDGPNKVAVKNCGVVGAGIQDVVDIYERESGSLPRGSLVIYGFVLNDFGLVLSEPVKGLNFIDINNGGNTFSLARKYSALWNFISHSIETRRLHTMTVNGYLQSFEGWNAENGFELLAKLNQEVVENDGTLLVVVFPLLYDFEEYRFTSIHDKISSFCDRNRIPYVDLFPSFSRHKAEDLWANPTDHHPNETAHRIAADEIATFIENELPGFALRPARGVGQ
ncbi:MAG: SGNH/GDSL hydrolase family protein [Thermoanaerobaculales bacterium]|nr:SGNH/GDSL hydrolase family protein [Thermoanaerobaculales bacterium]